MTWPDVLVVTTLIVAFWGGYRNGVVREFIDLGSIILSWFIAGAAAGTLADGIGPAWHLQPATAHLIAFWVLFLAAFVALRALGWFLERFSKLPVLKTVSGIGGGLVSCVKALLVIWLVLFVALFFPMASDVREALKNSFSIPKIELLDRPALAMIDKSLPFPWYTRPFIEPTLRRHHL